MMNWRLVTKLKLKNELREIFNKHDPIGIYRDKETNFDEYDPEIEQLPLVFNKTSSVKEFADKLHEILTKNSKISTSKPLLAQARYLDGTITAAPAFITLLFGTQ
ncbi:hypothetical protein HYU20_00720 [Candidatus Woesearchaeota archaeon]|nr:hypothetical protein [Candidatus Woesearchaeota archaeon]